MTWRTLALLAVLLPANAASPQDTKSFSDRDDLARDSLQSGSQFLTPETRATQSDDFANPGYLWVDRGETLFREGGETSCAACHAAESDHPMKGVATRYPKFDARADTLLDLSGRINLCRATFQAKPALAHESEDLLSLSAYVASRSRGMPMAVEVTAESQPWFDAGRDYFFRRRGQLNLACNQCHDDNWGRQLRGDTISQGHPNAWPVNNRDGRFAHRHRRSDLPKMVL